MLVSLPVAAYVLLVVGFVRRGSDGRSAVLHAATAWGVLAVLITETLSLPGWLTPAGLAAAWLLVDVALLAATACAAGGGRDGGTRGPRAASVRLGAADLALLGGTGLVIALVGAVALLSPPNTWDAMQYHLPRIVHWLQNRSVALYPTHELKQLHMAPGAEYLMLQLHALWGGDRLDNLMQWFAMLGSVVGVSVLARSLGAGGRGRSWPPWCARHPRSAAWEPRTTTCFRCGSWRSPSTRFGSGRSRPAQRRGDRCRAGPRLLDRAPRTRSPRS
jgi:hypothetical protein